MSKSAHTLHVRLSPELIRKFEAFHAGNFRGLPASLIARVLLTDQLEKPDSELAAIVMKHIQGKAPVVRSGANRVGPDTTRK
jgi:hypothetical protein